MALDAWCERAWRGNPVPMFYRPLPRTLEAALRDIADPSDRVRRSAIIDLARHARDAGSAEVQEGLTKALQDKDAMVRTQAAYALGDARMSGALPALQMAMEDDHPGVRQAAIDALGMIGDDRATARLVRALGDDRAEVRFQAIIALSRVSPKDARSSVLELAKDDDPHVRYVAVRVCEEIFSGEQGTASTAIELDSTVERAAEQWLTDIDEPVRVAAAILLARAGNLAGKSSLVRAVEGRVEGLDPEDATAAIELAGALGLQETREALERMAFAVVRRWRPDAGSWMALVALARMGHVEARARILGGLRAWSRDRRNAAAAAAGQARLREAAPVLAAMRGDASRLDPEVLEEALRLIERGETSPVADSGE